MSVNHLKELIASWYRSAQPGAETVFSINKDEAQLVELRKIHDFPRHPELWIDKQFVLHVQYYMVEPVQEMLSKFAGNRSCSLVLTVSKPARAGWASVLIVGIDVKPL